ncbi:MAG: TA system VapC family ribonuclease toxin [Burkholderiaceae bacterium]
MRNLLDINVVIALFDSDHPAHRGARAWLADHADEGWSSCPITQNGVLRVMSQPAYPNPLPISEVMDLLRAATAHPAHEFWADDISMLDEARIDASLALGPKQITDLYLLALAVTRHGRFVTFDRAIPINVVRGASNRHLMVL